MVHRNGAQEWCAGMVRRNGAQEWCTGMVHSNGAQCVVDDEVHSASYGAAENTLQVFCISLVRVYGRETFSRQVRRQIACLVFAEALATACGRMLVAALALSPAMDALCPIKRR